MSVHLLQRDLVVVHQKAKLVELTNQYELQDADGNGIGFVQEVGQSTGRKVLRALTKFDQYLSHRLEISDADGQAVLTLVRPAKFMKSRVDVADAAGAPLGSIVQQNVVGKKRFTFEAPDGAVVGELLGENWRSWDFQIVDPSGTEVASSASGVGASSTTSGRWSPNATRRAMSSERSPRPDAGSLGTAVP